MFGAQFSSWAKTCHRKKENNTKNNTIQTSAGIVIVVEVVVGKRGNFSQSWVTSSVYMTRSLTDSQRTPDTASGKILCRNSK